MPQSSPLTGFLKSITNNPPDSMELKHETENKFTVFFKDGTTIESEGSADAVERPSIYTEFEWAAFQVSCQISEKGKSLADVDRIEYHLTYKK